MPEVIAISRSDALAVLDDGTICHFATMLDIDGDETDDVLECVCAVVPLPGGLWEVLDLSEFETVRLN